MDMYEFLHNPATLWCVMSLVIFALTFVVKIPYKKFITSKITNETKRKIANKAIVIFTLALGIFLNFAYCYWCEIAFTFVEFGDGLKYGLSAIALYSALELKTSGAIENPFNNEDCKEVIDEVEKLVNNSQKNKTKKKDNKEKTAHEKFMDLVGQDNEN